MTMTNPTIEDRWQSATDLATNATTVIPLMSAMGAGSRRFIETVSCANVHSTITNVVRILSGTRLVDIMAVPPNQNASRTYNPPVPCDSNAAINFQGISACSTFFSVQGFNAKG